MAGRHIPLVWQHDPTLYAPARYRCACKYEAFVPDAIHGVEFSVGAHVAGVVSEAENAIRDLNAVARPALEPLARLLLRTESIASSSLREIQSIHQALMAGSPSTRLAGQLRTVQNWIGGNDYNPCGAEFVPPPPEHVVDLLDDLCAAINEDVLSPLVQAALVHAQFETIHPFDDGNGRTGRALIHAVLRRRGLASAYVPPISVVLASQRSRYIEGLTQYRSGEVGAWLEQFGAAAARSARLASAYLEAVNDLLDAWRARLMESGAPRADAAASAIIDVLPAHPIITTPVAAAATGRAKSAIHQAIGELETAGVLLPLSASRRNRSWEATGLLDLFASLELGDLPRRDA